MLVSNFRFFKSYYNAHCNFEFITYLEGSGLEGSEFELWARLMVKIDDLTEFYHSFRQQNEFSMNLIYIFS